MKLFEQHNMLSEQYTKSSKRHAMSSEQRIKLSKRDIKWIEQNIIMLFERDIKSSKQHIKQFEQDILKSHSLRKSDTFQYGLEIEKKKIFLKLCLFLTYTEWWTQM